MKRTILTFILIVVVVMFPALNSMAVDYNNPIDLFENDSDFFKLTDDEKNEFPDLIYNGKICVEYTKAKGTEYEKRVRCYCAVYSNYENFGAYMYQQEGSSGDVLDYLQYNYSVGDKVYIKWGSDLNDYNFVKLIDYHNRSYSSFRGFFYSYGYSGSSTVSFADNNAYDATIVSTEFPIFSNENDFLLYRQTGQINNALYDPTSYYNGDNLYFKEFTVIPHVTNNYDTFYFDIKYELSDFAKEHIEKLNLRFDNSYAMGVEGLASLIRLDADNSFYSISISMNDKPSGFKLYLKEIPCLYSLVDNKQLASKNNILGKELLIDFSKLSIDGVGLDTIANINHSYLYCQFYLRANINGKFYQGKRNDFNYDFLTKKSDFDVWKSTDNSSLNGNLNYVKDGQTVTSNEYYYNDTTTNNDGTVVNNYYYYDNDGKEHKITEDEYFNGYVNASGGNASASGGNASASATIGDININVNNGSGEYISLSPADFNQFVKGMEELLKQINTEGGLFMLLNDTFEMFPSDITKIIVGAISAITFVSAVCILRRR